MPQCGRKTLDLNIILMRATNPRKAMKCGTFHTRVLVAVYSYLIQNERAKRMDSLSGIRFK